MQSQPAFHRLPLLALAAVVWLLASLPVSAQDSYNCKSLGVTFPGSIASLPLVGVTDFEKKSPGLGVGISYRGEKIKGDIYIYNYGAASIPKGVASQLITDHFYSVSKDVVQMEKLGYYKHVKVITQKEETKIGPMEFLHAEMRFTQDGLALESHVYLTAVSNQFVKIRFTYPESDAGTAKSIRDAFLDKLATLLSSNPKA